MLTEHDRPTLASPPPRSDGRKYGPTQTSAAPSTLSLVRMGLLTERMLSRGKPAQVLCLLRPNPMDGQVVTASRGTRPMPQLWGTTA
jgi:hypothetical protein